MSSPPAAAAAPQVLLSASYQRAAPRRGGGCGVPAPRGAELLFGATTPPLSAAAGFILTAQPDLASFISPLRSLVFLQLLKRHLVCTEPPGELLHLQAQIQLPPLRAVGAPLGGEILALLRASCSPSPALQEPDAHLRGSLGAVSPRGAVPVPPFPTRRRLRPCPEPPCSRGRALRSGSAHGSLTPRCQHRGPGAAPGLSRAPGTPRCQPRPPPPVTCGRCGCPRPLAPRRGSAPLRHFRAPPALWRGAPTVPRARAAPPVAWRGGGPVPDPDPGLGCHRDVSIISN